MPVLDSDDFWADSRTVSVAAGQQVREGFPLVGVAMAVEVRAPQGVVSITGPMGGVFDSATLGVGGGLAAFTLRPPPLQPFVQVDATVGGEVTISILQAKR